MTGTKKAANQLSPTQRAIFALKKASSKIEQLERAPIAIVGMSCRFPGGANDLDSFWDLLRDGKDAVREVSPKRWDMEKYYDPVPGTMGKIYTKSAALLNVPIEDFDPLFFGISPLEAKNLDPQHRLLLEVSWEALENAGISPQKLPEKTGIYIGMMENDQTHLMRSLSYPDVYSVTGNDTFFASGRLAHQLGIKGPNIVVGAACASSLITPHLACQSLRSRETDLALAGGVQILISPETSIGVAKIKALSPDGRCKTFDRSADGYGRGEGCGIVVLKRLSDAQADGDHIWGVIRGSATNHNGANSGLTVPDRHAQESVIKQALQQANLTGDQLGYVEAHGTGTALGDPIEINALMAALGDREEPLLVGSVKSNIGHLEPAAGVAGLIKTALVLHHGEIPANLHFKNPNPYIDWDHLPLKVVSNLTPWPRGEKVRIAGINSFGMGGANAHVIVSEAPIRESIKQVDRPLHLLTLSAKADSALMALIKRYEAFFSGNVDDQDFDFADFCATSNQGRAHFKHRLSIVAPDGLTAHSKLKAAKSDRTTKLRSPSTEQQTQPKIAFLFTGQGSQYLNMGRELFETQPLFRRILERCDEILRPWLKQGLLAILYGEQGKSPDLTLDDTAYTQPALFALEYALAKLWQSWGVEPEILIGHSVGEYAAACLAGVFSLEDGLKLIAERARLMQALPRDGAMLSVLSDERTVRNLLKPFAQDVEVAVVNGPTSVVLSGRKTVMNQIVELLAAKEIKTRKLSVSHAFHSMLMEPMLADFEQVAAGISYHLPQMDLVSNVTGDIISEEVATPAYWCRHIRHSVQFDRGMKTLAKANVDVFLEIGPSPTLLGMGRQCLEENTTHLWLPSLRQTQNDWQQMLDSLSACYQAGVEVNWVGFEKEYHRKTVVLPNYPFQRQRYWMDYDLTRLQQPQEQKLHPLLGNRIESAVTFRNKEILFETKLSKDLPQYLADHRILGQILLPASAFLEVALAAGREIFQSRNLRIDNFVIQKALALAQEEARFTTLQLVLSPAIKGYHWQLFSLREEENEKIWIQHASGELRSSEEKIESTDSLEQLKARCVQAVDLEAHYLWFQEREMDYGPNFQSIEQIFTGEREVLGKLQLPEAIRQDGAKYLLHPVLLDACLRLAAVSISSEVGADEIYLPAEIHSLSLLGDLCEENLWASAQLQNGAPASSGSDRILDITLFNSKGQLCAKLSGFVARKVNPQVFKSSFQSFENSLNKLFYVPQWLPATLSNQIAAAGKIERLLLVYPAQTEVSVLGLISKLKESFNATRVYEIALGVTNQALTDDRWEVQVDDPTAIKKVLEQLSGVDGVYFFSGQYNPDECHQQSLQQSQEEGVLSLFRLVKALKNKALITDAARFVVLTQDAWAVGDGDQSNPYVAALTGFSRSMAKEFPDLEVVCLDIASNDLQTKEQCGKLCREILAEPGTKGAEHVAIRDGIRYKNSPVSLQLPTTEKMTFRERGTYLIIGGAGGLGLTLSTYLAKTYQARLILTGRSQPSAELQKRLSAITEQGGEVLYQQANLTDLESMQSVVAKAKETFGTLNGVFHSALVLRDSTIINLKEESLKIALAPKILGSLVLHQAVAQEPLDFMVFFSSAQSFVGSAGQSAYAAGNTFKDSFALYLGRKSSFPVKVINWGFWGDAGAVASEEHHQRFLQQGIEPIDSQEGMQALEKILGNPLNQMLAIKANPRGLALLDAEMTLKAELVDPESSEEGELLKLMKVLKPLAAPSLTGDGGAGKSQRAEILRQLRAKTKAEQQTVIESYLQKQVVSFVGVDASDLPDTQKSYLELGVDSLLSIELSNNLKQELEVKVPVEKILGGITIEQLGEYLLPLLMNTKEFTIKADAYMDRENAEIKKTTTPVPISRDQRLPLSFSQEHVWQHNLKHPGDPVFNVPAILTLSGLLDESILKRSFDAVISRHEILRTSFEDLDGSPVQVIHSKVEFTISKTDLSHLELEEQDKTLKKLKLENFREPFDVTQGPLMRATLVKTEQQSHVLLLCIYHLVIDAQSLMILLDELIQFYESFRLQKASPLLPLPIQYADFAYWQRQYFDQEALQSRLDYWRELLGKKNEPLNLSTKSVARDGKAKESKHVDLKVSADLTKKLKELAKQTNTTLYMILLTAFIGVLHRRSGCEDISIGAPMSQRHHSETERLIGYFSGMSVLRVEVKPHLALSEFLLQVKDVVISAMNYQDLSFRQLTETLQVDDLNAGQRPYQVALNFLPTQSDEIKTPTLTFSPAAIQRKVMLLDIALNIEEQENPAGEKQIKGFWRYRKDLFEVDEIERMIHDFNSLLLGMLKDPQQSIKQLFL